MKRLFVAPILRARGACFLCRSSGDVALSGAQGPAACDAAQEVVHLIGAQLAEVPNLHLRLARGSNAHTHPPGRQRGTSGSTPSASCAQASHQDGDDGLDGGLNLAIRAEVERGRPLALFFGVERVEAMGAFIEGCVTCMHRHGCPDRRWGAFMAWLRGLGAFPAEGWEVGFLRDCAGDSRRAMLRFLDLVGRFVEQHPG